MKALRIIALIVFAISGLGVIAEEKYEKYLSIFEVSGLVALASVLIEVLIPIWGA